MPTRTNASTNPSFEVNTSGWSATRGTLSNPSSAAATAGAKVGRYTSSDASTSNGNYVGTGAPNELAVTPGATVPGSLDVLATAGSAGDFGVWWQWYTSGNVFVSSSTPTVVTVAAGTTPTRISHTATAPATAAKARLYVGARNRALAVGQYFDVDSVMLGAGAYFDGDSPRSAWAGTPGSSASTQTVPAVTAALIGELAPPLVQVVVTDLIVGDEYEVTGSLGDQSWTVRAGVGVAAATQLVLVDLAAPINAPVTYTVSIPEDSVTVVSAPVVVPWAPNGRASTRYLLSSLDGQLTAALRWLDNGDPRDHDLRVAFHTVEGRSRPVPVYDLEAGETRTYVVVTEGDHTAALRELVRSGAPLLLRTDGSLADFAPCDYIQLKSAASGLRRGNQRKWTLGLEVIDDPEPDTLVAASTWDDFDAAYAGLTWAGFDGDWAGQTWNDFDREDWDSRA